MSLDSAGDHYRCREVALRVQEQAAALGLAAPGRLWGIAPFVAFLVLLAAIALAGQAPLPVKALALVLAGYCNVVLAFVGHDAAHGVASRSPFWNDGIGVWTLGHSFTTYHGFRLLHAAHHRHTGSDEDPTGDSPSKLEAVNLFTYFLFVVLPLGFPLFVIAPSWLGGFGYQPHVFLSGERWKIRRNIAWIVAYQAAYLALARWIGGPDGPAFAMAAFVAGLWITTMMNAQAHAAVIGRTDCKLCNTRTVRTGAVLGLLTANGGYHVEHHLLPQLPWYRLPAAHALLEREGGSRFVDEGFIALHASLVRRYFEAARK